MRKTIEIFAMLFLLIISSVVLGVFVDRIWLYYHYDDVLIEDDLAQWLESDNTDAMKYQDGFKCLQFSNMMVSRAMSDNIESSIAILHYNSSTSHAVVSFPYNDRVLFVNPQTDRSIGYIDTKYGLKYIELISHEETE